MPRTLPLLALLTGCRVDYEPGAPSAVPPPTDGPAVEEEPEPEPDTTPTADTAVVVTTFSGDYTGLVGANITYQPTIGGYVEVFQCTGPIDTTISSGSPGVVASGTCVTDYAEVIDIQVVGGISTLPFVVGTLTVTHPDFTFDDDWAGEFTIDEFDVERLEGVSSELISGPPEINSYVNFTVKH